MTMTPRSFTRTSVALAAVAALTLAGCGKDTDVTDAVGEATSSAAAAATSAAAEASEAATSAASEASSAASSAAAAATDVFSSDNIEFKDAYVKAGYAKEAPEGSMAGMTAIFGTIVNNSDEAAHIVGFTDNTGAKRHEIHEVVNGKMQEKKGGLMIDAGAEHVLKPGSDHLMLMGLTKDIKPGEKITVTLEFDNGDKVTFDDLPVRDLAAGNEEYSSGHDMDGEKMDMDGEKMDMDGEKMSDHDMADNEKSDDKK